MIPRQSLSTNAFTSASFPRKRESMLLLTRPVTKVLDSRFHGGVAPPACGKDAVLMVRDWMLTVRDWAIPVRDWAIPVRDWMLTVRDWTFPVRDWMLTVRDWTFPVRDWTLPV